MRASPSLINPKMDLNIDSKMLWNRKQYFYVQRNSFHYGLSWFSKNCSSFIKFSQRFVRRPKVKFYSK